MVGKSGLTLRDGVVCNANLCAGPETVFVAGDVLRWPNALFADVDADMRVEHWTNAAEQGAHAATNLLAALDTTEQTPYSAVPFFWSDQFDARIQCLGRPSASAVVDVVAGNPADGKWCAMYSVNNRLTAVLGVSQPKLVMPSRALLSTHTSREDALAHFAARHRTTATCTSHTGGVTSHDSSGSRSSWCVACISHGTRSARQNALACTGRRKRSVASVV